MSDVTTIHGIPNCDTVKKARKWLDANEISYEFHDYKKKGIDKATLNRWCKQAGWEPLLNTRGTTWRKLDDDDKKDLTQAKVISLLQANTSMIKRPVVTSGSVLLIGFDEARYQEVFL